MKIESTSLSLEASHQSLIHRERSETLRAWRGNQRPDFEAQNRLSDSLISISQSAQRALALDIQSMGANPAPPPTHAETDAIESIDDAVQNDPYLSMIRSMIEFLTGRPVRALSAPVPEQNAPPTVAAPPEPQGHAANPPANQEPVRAGFGIEYDRHEVYAEVETTHFSAQGMVRTQDGQEIRFSLELQMERSYREETSVSLRAGDAVRKDPLVVNFAGTAPRLLDQRFRFDLDNDGQAEELPMLGSGSGYLAFDRNNNGQIDAGNELFGPASNNGFAELALLDADGNGWLDENDPLFSRLGIWRPTDGSSDNPYPQLTALKDNGIGALGLAHLETPFELRGSGNSDLGAVRATGLALTEDGRTLALQEIDLTLA
jgi:hypothetical protein